MERNIYEKLKEWKASTRRKPLVLRGARQTGKTYILKEFGEREYSRLVYFNFEEDSLLDGFFARDLNPARIIEELSIYADVPIEPHNNLIFFDEIQASDNALNALKYFQEQAHEYHVVAAGSLLGVKVSSPKSFPVGKVNFIDLFPMTFEEFLKAMGKGRLVKLLSDIDVIKPLSEPFHLELVGFLRKYFFCGGMPEAVECLTQTADLHAVRKVQKEIIEAYILDFAKHASSYDIPKLSHIWDSIPTQLAHENKKFMFSAIRKSARAREYESAINWLEDANLISRAFCVNKAQLPLKGFRDHGAFKVYALDVGLLGAMAGLSPKLVVSGNRAFEEYSGALTESFVAQTLVATLGANLFYWKSSGGTAEVDYLLELDGMVVPLEVKAGVNPKSKSLRSFDQQYCPKYLLRTTLLGLRLDERILNIPLYALNNLSKFLDTFCPNSGIPRAKAECSQIWSR